MGRATSGVTGMKFRAGDSMLSMSVIRAEQVAAEEAAEAALVESGETPDSIAAGDLPGVREQYVFTITDGGFAKRSRISDYRLQSRGGLGIKTMSLGDETRGTLVGAFIVEEGDEVMSITQSGQVVRTPVDAALRPIGRATKGVGFVRLKAGDAVAVVARSVEAREVEEGAGAAGSQDDGPDATIEESQADTDPIEPGSQED
jgi:DNA gyrase subunit A